MSLLMFYSLVLPVHCLAFGKYRYVQPSISISVRACAQACVCVRVCLSVFMLQFDCSMPDV